MRRKKNEGKPHSLTNIFKKSFFLALLESLGIASFPIWFYAWEAGNDRYPIQKEKVKELLLKNLEEEIIKEES